MHFIITNRDRDGAAEDRARLRPKHIAYLKAARGVEVVHGGPILDASGGMAGSHLVVVAPSREAVTDFAAGDPFAEAGLFESSTIDAWNWVIGNPDAAPH